MKLKGTGGEGLNNGGSAALEISEDLVDGTGIVGSSSGCVHVQERVCSVKGKDGGKGKQTQRCQKLFHHPLLLSLSFLSTTNSNKFNILIPIYKTLPIRFISLAVFFIFYFRYNFFFKFHTTNKRKYV